jgi:hypothetical protein
LGTILDEKALRNELYIGLMIIILIPLMSLLIVFYYQGFQGIKDWLVPISGCVSLITVAVGSWVAVNNYRLKIETEKRLSDSSLVESDVKLIKLFSEIMEIAHSRHNPIVSEKAIEELFRSNIITINDFNLSLRDGEKLDNDFNNMAKKKLETAILQPRYGTASQDAAIASVYTLGKKHRVLLDPSIEGLIAINRFVNTGNDIKKKEMVKGFVEALTEHKKRIESGK